MFPTFLHSTIYLVVILGILSVSEVLAVPTAFDRGPWLKDYAELKEFLATTYANLDWMIEKGRVNVSRLDSTTLAELGGAKSEKDARNVLRKFIGEFKDPHLRIEDPGPVTVARSHPGITKKMSAADACAAMGFKKKNGEFLYPVPDEKRSSRGAFRYGVLPISDKHSIGLIRIASFLESHYPSLCLEEWPKFRTSIRGKCDTDCQRLFTIRHVANELLREFRSVLDRLKKLEVAGLLVDVTNNGGGTDWEVAVARMLTPKPLSCGMRGFIRHPHHASRVEVEMKCNRSEIWESPKVAQACPLVAMKEVVDCAPDPVYRHERGSYRGPLFFLANRRSSSATEDLLARHQDSKTGVVLGERTNGAGCGYTNGGISRALAFSKLTVKVPDCVRARANGDNEVQGVEPDLPLDMKTLSRDFVSSLKSAISERLGKNGG